ncbi:predicted protein [Naegleria gruberi]|uniref:Predicted protein n=1 Tax=Naegleria gruberi TaxID=5762 RepID=D2V1N4_NAEGR|nr:uncharacterized protein NAEGRDRAFT_62638 [Naegleria gruberi]EFC49193.1 predicted protein [Naegleria gruberi]|eukprot:XP_002681937.1 predicted protein [Naegleria gruberi strain NEG-M]
MKRQFQDVSSANTVDTTLKKVKENPHDDAYSLLDQLSEECIESVLVFLGVLKKVFHDKIKMENDEDNDDDDDYTGLIVKGIDRNQFAKHAVVNWQQLRNISLVSKNLFSKCAPFMFEHETRQVTNQVFDNIFSNLLKLS